MMNQIIKVLYEKRQQKMRNSLKEIRALEKHLPELPESCEGILTNNDSLRIGMPLDPPLVKQVIDLLEDAGFSVSAPKLSEWGYWEYYDVTYRAENGKHPVDFELAAMDFRTGATCKLKKIGTEPTEQDIYEVVCIDGAEESAP